MENRSILKEIRQSVGLSATTTDFDTDLLLHINSALSKLNQVGVGRHLVVTNDEQTWNDFADPNQVVGNESFQLVPLYVSLTTKIIFDPPPPSTVEYYAKNSDELLWRLKIAYETGEDVENATRTR